MTNDQTIDVKSIWRAHGGRQHGPNVEQYYIEEQAFYRFASSFRDAIFAAFATQERDAGNQGELFEAYRVGFNDGDQGDWNPDTFMARLEIDRAAKVATPTPDNAALVERLDKLARNLVREDGNRISRTGAMHAIHAIMCDLRTALRTPGPRAPSESEALAGKSEPGDDGLDVVG